MLGGVIEKASGKRMDIFFAEHFFKPMNINEFDWIKDEEGNPTAHGAFILKPSDFAKFGLLLLNKGKYEGVQILSEESIDLCLQQSFEKEPIFGLLWYRQPKSQVRIIDDEILAEWRKVGISEKVISQLAPMIGKSYHSREEFFEDWLKLMGNDWQTKFQAAARISKRKFSEEIIAYSAQGFFGNFLVILPKLNLVAVRCASYREDFDFNKDGFDDFPALVQKLLKE